MLRQDLRSWTRTNWWIIAQLLAYGLGLAALCLGFAVWWPRSNDFLQGLIAGIGVAVLVAILGLAFLINTGNIPRLVGAWAEDDTDAALKAAVKARQIHGYVSHIVLDGYDIDAVAITSSGVVAIETKWHGKPPTEVQVRRDVASARRAEAKTRSILRSLHCSTTPVTGVVAVWGPQRGHLGTGLTSDDLDVVPGDLLPSWLERHGSQGAIHRIEGERLRDLLEGFAQTHGPHAAKPAARVSSVSR